MISRDSLLERTDDGVLINAYVSLMEQKANTAQISKTELLSNRTFDSSKWHVVSHERMLHRTFSIYYAYLSLIVVNIKKSISLII